MKKLVYEADLGDSVVCDECSEDYTNSEESGGFIFGSHGVCPKCADRLLKSIKKYNEEEHIKSYCPRGMSFKQFILNYRGTGEGNKIKMYEGDVFNN